MFRKPKKQDGSVVIAETLDQFEDIISNLETGASMNDSKVADNERVIAALQNENTTRSTTSTRGRSIAQKLREFIEAP